MGGTENDALIGGTGGDTVAGEDGDDLMVWNNGDGSDIMDGGNGTDTVQVNGAPAAGDNFLIQVNPADPTRLRFDRCRSSASRHVVRTSHARKRSRLRSCPKPRCARMTASCATSSASSR